MFPIGNLIEAYGEEEIEETQELLSQNETVLFQAAFEWNGFHIRADVLELTEEGFNIYEVKGFII